MTLWGLTLFIGMSTTTWGKYRLKKDFIDITTRVEQIIKHQKFTGAAAGLLNPNIIARDLGLSDKQDIDQTVKTSGTVIQTEPVNLDTWLAMGKESQAMIDKAHEKLHQK